MHAIKVQFVPIYCNPKGMHDIITAKGHDPRGDFEQILNRYGGKWRFVLTMSFSVIYVKNVHA